MTPNVFLSKKIIILSLLSILMVPVSGQDIVLPAGQKLYDQIAYQDSAMFSVIYKCQIEKASTYFTDDVEFYHDKGGTTYNRKDLLEVLKKNFCGPDATVLRRELIKGTLNVYPMEKYGAVETGEHRFYITEPGQPERVSGIAKFSMLWKLINNEWKITRVFSYDHQPPNNTNAANNAPSNLAGIRDTLYSEILKEKRVIEVVLPSNFRVGNQNDVLYVLDGEGNTQMTRQVEEYVRENGFMPEPIIVGVYNTNRDRDLTPTHPAAGDNYGGADKFLSFLQQELIPYINKKYEVKGSNGIFGHSFGGLFAMYAFLTRPQVFDTYLAADPSFWWDNRYMRKLTMEKLDSQLHKNKAIWISGRGGKESEDMGIPSIDSILKAKAPAGLDWKVVDYPGETHNSIKYKSVYDGLRFFYSGFNSTITFHPQTGTVTKGKPAKLWFFTPNNGKIRYTTDGSEPTLSSPLIEPEVILNGGSQLTIKSFASHSPNAAIIKANFKEGTTLKAVAKPKNVKPGGLNYKYYEGSWDKLPDFKQMKPVLSGRLDSAFNWSKLPRKINFATLIEGYLEIKEEGYYVFGVSSDDGSKLFINNQLVVDADGLHDPEDRSGIVPLEKGFYPIRIEYFQKEGGMNINLIYVTPSVGAPTPVKIPFEVMYSN